MSDHLSELKKHIDEITLMSPAAWVELEHIVRISEIDNEEYLVREGSRTLDETFLVQGILRSFYRSYDGEEVNVAFYTENTVLPPHYFRTKHRERYSC